MKKRILSAIIMSALVLSMTACGTSTDTPDTANSADVTTAAAEEAETTAAEEEKTEATTTTPEETEATTTTTEAPKEILKIKDSPGVYFDSMSFKVDGKNYVYNAVDNKMYECGANKIYFALGKMAVDNSYELHNLETKESYDLETGICKESYIRNQYIPVHKKEQNFDGDVTYFGILDKNGEWVLPLSSEYAICKRENFYGAGSATASLVRSGYEWVYDYKNDKLTDFVELYLSGQTDYLQAYAISDDKVLCYDDRARNYVFYNPSTGEETPVNAKGSYKNYSHIIDTQYFVDKNGYFAVIDKNFEVLYEIAGYEAVGLVYDATENYVVFSAKGADSGRYTIILDKDGNRVVEPISEEADSAFITGDYVVVDKQIVNCKTGEIKTCPYFIYDVMLEAGMMVVKSDGAYYLVDPADPETLINPFEIAE